MNGNNKMNLNLDLTKMDTMRCSCGGEFFSATLGVKLIPALLSPVGEAGFAMVQVGFCCLKCGEITPMSEAKPKETKQEIDLVR